MFRPSEEPEEPVSPEPSQPRGRPKPRPHETRLRRWGRRTLRGLGALVVVYSGLNIYASIRLNRALERARAQGEPLTMMELAPPPVPSALNAAPLYEQADKALAYARRDEENLLKLGLPESSPSDNTEALRILARNQSAVNLVRQGSLLPSCQFAVDWRQQPALIQFPQYARMRRLARLMSAQALAEARSGDTDGALRDARAVFALSAHLKDEQILIGFLVARAIDAIANRAVARVVESAPITAAQARRFEASLPPVNWSASFRRAMLGERAFGLSAFEMMRSSPLQAGKGVAAFTNGGEDDAEEVPLATRLLTSPLGALWAPFLKLDQAEVLRLWEMHLAAITPMPVPMPASRMAPIDKALQEVPPYAVMTKILFPVFARSYLHREAAEVGRRQRQAALALAVYRTAHGSHPAQLSQAEPGWGALPRDLYGSQPLRYIVDGDSFHLYSVGPNGVDDGGRSASGLDLSGRYIPDSPSQPRGDDIVWNFRRR